MNNNNESIFANIIFLILSILFIVLFSLFFASVINLQVQNSIKILIFSIFCLFIMLIIILVVLLLIETNQIKKNQGSIIIYLRLIYIAVEKQRLEPESEKLSKDILFEDLYIEEQIRIGHNIMRKASLGYWKYFINFLWIIWVGLYVLGTIICTILILKNWDAISRFFF